MPYDINAGLGLLGQFGNQWGTAPQPPLPAPGTVMPNSGNGVTATVPSIASQNLPQQNRFNPFQFLSGLGGMRGMFPFLGGFSQFMPPQLQQRLSGIFGNGQMPQMPQAPTPPTGAPGQNPFQNFMPTNFGSRFGNWGQ